MWHVHVHVHVHVAGAWHVHVRDVHTLEDLLDVAHAHIHLLEHPVSARLGSTRAVGGR